MFVRGEGAGGGETTRFGAGPRRSPGITKQGDPLSQGQHSGFGSPQIDRKEATFAQSLLALPQSKNDNLSNDCRINVLLTNLDDARPFTTRHIEEGSKVKIVSKHNETLPLGILQQVLVRGVALPNIPPVHSKPTRRNQNLAPKRRQVHVDEELHDRSVRASSCSWLKRAPYAIA